MPSAPTRRAEFAGSFYPSDEGKLSRFLERLLLDHRPDDGALIHAQGCFVPHAGYMYSAECAAATLAKIEIPDIAVLLHTKHTPQGKPLSISTYTAWETPLGRTPVSKRIADLLNTLGPAKYDETAEEGEHAAEVVLPFLQMLNRDLEVCVISVAGVDNATAKALGRSVAAACKEVGDSDVLIVSSTDMNHYESRIRTEKLDDIALEQMEKMNPDGLLDAVRANKISMCGASATAVMLHACIELGCKECVVVDHTDSADASGDYERVVGYASGYVI